MTEATEDAMYPWTDPAWREDVMSWVTRELGRRGITVTAEVEQPHLQWWSTALRIPTDHGEIWFKASREGTEAALMPILTELFAGDLVELIAADTGRGWTLSRSAGVRLREAVPGREQLERWRELLPRYAQLQIELASHCDQILALGFPDYRLKVMPPRLAAVLEDRGALFLGSEDSLSEAKYDQLLSGTQKFDSLCRELASAGIPETLQHDDLNDANIFIRDNGIVFFDWGDACISHPFHSLVVALRTTAYKLELDPGGPEVMSLRDAYLRGWAAYGSRDDLGLIAEMARRTGTVQRALAWYDAATNMPSTIRAENIDAVPYGLKLYLADSPWGTWQ